MRSWARSRPKSVMGRRDVPIVGLLRVHLLELRMRSVGKGRLFRSHRFVQGANDRAKKAWEGTGLPIVVLHGGRHTFASLMIAANVNVEELSTWLGHSNVAITLDTYGHLLSSSGPEAVARFDAFMEAQLARAARPADGPTAPQTAPHRAAGQ